MKAKGIGYVRVSTDQQAEHGVSLEAQVEKIRAMATVHDVELLDVIVDAGESAKDLDRPGMVRILKMVQSRAIGMVIVAKLDRLTRSVKDLAVLLEQFQRRGVSLVSVAESLDTGSASGRLVLNIMVSVSQWEREAIGESTRDAMQLKRNRHEFVGNAPYGYRQAADKRHVEPEPGEQAILQRIHRLRKGGKSLRKIAEQLNRLKIRTRQGSPWRHEYVARLLKAASRHYPQNALTWMVRQTDMPIQKLTPEIITAAILGFEEQKRHIDSKIAELRAMLPGGPSETAATPEVPTSKRRKFSAAARRRMREAQQRRWASIRGQSEPSAPATPEAPKPKRKLSAAGRRAIQDAVRRRWAQKRADAAKAQPTSAKKTTRKKGAKKAAKKPGAVTGPAVA